MTDAEVLAIAGALTALATPFNTLLTIVIMRRQSANRTALDINTALTVAGNAQVQHLHTCVETKAEEIKSAVADARNA